MTELVKKLYVNGQVVAVGDYTVEEKTEEAKYTIRIFSDSDATNPHDMSDEVLWFSNHRDYRFDGSLSAVTTNDNKSIDDFDGFGAFLKALNKSKEYKYYPVYAFIHSGISLSTEPFSGPDARWDSGMFALACVERQKTEEATDELFKSDFEDMEAYITGEIYGFKILDEAGNIVECIGGYYGDKVEESILADVKQYGITLKDIEEAFSDIEYR